MLQVRLHNRHLLDPQCFDLQGKALLEFPVVRASMENSKLIELDDSVCDLGGEAWVEAASEVDNDDCLLNSSASR